MIQKCIAFSPDSRYQTVSDLRKDLQKILAGIMDENTCHVIRVENAESARRGHWAKPFLPVGFRTGTIWKMLVGVLGYYLIFLMGLTMKVTRSDGGKVTSVYLWANRLMLLSWLLLSVAFYGDYLGLQKKLPLMTNKYLRWIGYVIWPVIFFVVLVLVFMPIAG